MDGWCLLCCVNCYLKNLKCLNNILFLLLNDNMSIGICIVYKIVVRVKLYVKVYCRIVIYLCLDKKFYSKLLIKEYVCVCVCLI